MYLPASAQLMFGRLYGQAAIGDGITLVSGNFAVMSAGELFLGSHSPSGLQTNTLNITGNYEGEAGARVYHTIRDNSNATGTKGFINIEGTATGSTGIILDMHANWDGATIDLIKAFRVGSDISAFRMTETEYGNHTAVLLHRIEGNSLIWYIAEKTTTEPPVDDCMDLIYQKLNNTLVVNNNPATNGDYLFAYYTWYKDGVKITGESHDRLGGHYYTGGRSLDPDAEYWAEVITTEGERFRTCPFTPVIQTKTVSVEAYPNPTTRFVHTVTVRVETDDADLLNTATIDIYSATGAYIGRVNVMGRDKIPVTLPPVQGVYMLQFKSEAIDKNMKIIVE
jgi:hypothetical protein